MGVHRDSSSALKQRDFSADRVSGSGFWWPWLDDAAHDSLAELAALTIQLGDIYRRNDGADRTPLIERLQKGAGENGRVVLARIGELLAARAGEHPEPQLGRQIHTAQGIVRAGVGNHRAKRIQRELSNGNPLTVCFGRSIRKTGFNPPHHIVAFHNGDGCGAVCSDSSRKFRETCDYCRHNRQFGREARTIANDMRNPQRPRGLPILGDVDGVPSTLWEGWCANCGGHLISTERQTKLCGGCGK